MAQESTNQENLERMEQHFKIEKEMHINANIEKVWDVVTENPSDFNGVVIEMKTDWQPGSDIIFAFTWDGKEYNDKGKILAFEENEIFSHSYWSAFSGLPDEPKNYSEVTYKLVSNDDGTLLKLTHNKLATKTMYEHSNTNWEETLNAIKQKAEK